MTSNVQDKLVVIYTGNLEYELEHFAQRMNLQSDFSIVIGKREGESISYKTYSYFENNNLRDYGEKLYLKFIRTKDWENHLRFLPDIRELDTRHRIHLR